MTTGTMATVQVRIEGSDHTPELELDLSGTTPTQVLTHLRAEGFIRATGPGGEVMGHGLFAGDRRLESDQPLGVQGVTDKTLLTVRPLNLKGIF